MDSEWPQIGLEKDVNMIMTDAPGPGKPPSHYFPLARTIYSVIIKQLALRDIDEPQRGKFVKRFLLAAINISDSEARDKHLNSARELLGFSRHEQGEIDRIVDQDDQAFPPPKAKYTRDSKAVRLHLAVLEQADPNPISRPTARKRQRDNWAPAVVQSLHVFLREHRDQAVALALELGATQYQSSQLGDITPSVSVAPAPSAGLRRLRSLSRAYWQDLNVAAGQFGEQQVASGGVHTLSDGLYIRRSIQTRVIKKISEQVVSSNRQPILVKGEAGHGKSCLMWALDEELRSVSGIDPILLNATWFMPDAHGRSVINHDDVVSASNEISDHGSTPIVLIDTADLLLHNEIDIVELRELCEELTRQQAIVALACRPEEAGALEILNPSRFELMLYDNRELADAVEKYAEVFCPNAEPRDPEDRVRLITEPVARGLTLREVCRSPLLMRLLFELNPHADTFPELREVDVSRIYHEYWNRRVETDKRLEKIPTLRSSEVNLSGVAGRIAIVLLAMGRTEVDRNVLIDHVARVSPGSKSDDVSKSVDELLGRSVLLRSNSGRIRFFHQTMFEYAAAKGLIARYGSDAAYSILQKLIDQPEDLFVGAVLEQLLILSGKDPLAHEVFTNSMSLLVQSKHISLHHIALAAAAHHPRLSDPVVVLLETANEETASRYAQIAPSVAEIDLNDVLVKLKVVWNRDRCRSAVLESLERLAARDPGLVVAALRNWSCIQIICQVPQNRINFPVVPRILGMTASADRDFARAGLLRLFYDSKDLKSDDTRGRNFQISILEICQRYWRDLVGPEFVAELTARFADLQKIKSRSARDMQKSLGRLLGSYWLQLYVSELSNDSHVEDACEGSLCWIKFVQGVVSEIEIEEFDPVANAQLVGIGCVLAALPSKHWALEPCFALLTSMTRVNGPFSLSRGVFPEILRTDSAATVELEARLAQMLRSLPAPKNGAQLGKALWAAVARQTLRNAELAPDRLANLLRSVPGARQPELWLSNEGLAWLLVTAALGGHSVARTALAQLVANPELATSEAHELIRDPLENLVSRFPELVSVLVDLSSAQATTSPLNAVLRKNGARLRREFEQRVSELWTLVETLLSTTSGEAHRDGATLWSLLDRFDLAPVPDLDKIQAHLRHVTDYRARGSILELCATLARRTSIPFKEARELLEETFVIDGWPPVVTAVVKPRNYPGRAPKGLSSDARDFAVRGRNSLVDLLCQAGPIDSESVAKYLDLATALPTDSNVMGQLGCVVVRLVDSGKPIEGVRYLLDVVSSALVILRRQEADGSTSLSEDNLGNSLRPAMRKIFQSRNIEACALLLNSVPELPETHARMVVASAASEAYDATYDALSGLLAIGDQLPRDVGKQITSDRTKRSRSRSQIRLDDILKAEYVPMSPLVSEDGDSKASAGSL